MRDEQSRLVYSTDGEQVVQAKTRPRKDARSSGTSRNAQPSRASDPSDGFVRIRREKSGRGGKTVTSITGLSGSERELNDLLKVLKQHCGAGGTREGVVLEIQGDHRDRVEAKLSALGHRVKRAGG